MQHQFHYMYSKTYFTCFLLLIGSLGHTQVTLNADGPGDTYNLITSVLAPGYNPIEVPDCNHSAFGEHIDEIFDNDLGSNVFRFFIHVSPDDDRCINFDRQRNEIKTYGNSPDNLLGTEGEEVVYKWKFKLNDGFQSSPNFTHLHQLKPVGGPNESLPMYTLTTRKGNPDQLELRYASTSSQSTLTKTPLAPFIGEWLEVEEIITYSLDAAYDLKISRVSDGEVLFSYSNDAIDNWRPGGDYVRPKWGIYRSLDNSQDLRDEEVLYADFSIEEIDIQSSNQEINNKPEAVVFNNPVQGMLRISQVSLDYEQVEIWTTDGRPVLRKPISASRPMTIDLSALSTGIYVLNFRGEKDKLSKLIFVENN